MCACIGLCVLLWTKKYLVIDRTGQHPLKLIYMVLKYSWKHKVPERRSAFTYWEEDIPARIDLGKNKYGGSFTTEEVEDTKTFLRILLLLLSLVGFSSVGPWILVARSVDENTVSFILGIFLRRRPNAICLYHCCIRNTIVSASPILLRQSISSKHA